jgi:hypothetical protein
MQKETLTPKNQPLSGLKIKNNRTKNKNKPKKPKDLFIVNKMQNNAYLLTRATFR